MRFTLERLRLAHLRLNNGAYFLPKMELLQNLWQTFACVASEKKTFSKKWSCLKILKNDDEECKLDGLSTDRAHLIISFF